MNAKKVGLAGALVAFLIAGSKGAGHQQRKHRQDREPGHDDDNRPGQVEKTVAHVGLVQRFASAWERKANAIDPVGRTPYIAAKSLN